MELLHLPIESLAVHVELTRTATSRTFDERLKASILEMGLAEPLKVARDDDGSYLVIDGVLRLKAIQAIHADNDQAFRTVPAYVLDYSQRYEIRYQSDVYQDLLPSQLAVLVEHLHQAEGVRKADIARYIGVSPATLRNYTGLWRLLQRGGLFAGVVEVMDAGIFPASNPYAWLRLTPDGLLEVLTTFFTEGEDAEQWIRTAVDGAAQGHARRFTTTYVEDSTSSLPADRYREGSDLRAVKRDLGLRRSKSSHASVITRHWQARAHVSLVASETPSEVVRVAAESLLEFLS